MTGETPGVEYQKFDKDAIFTTVFGRLWRGKFETIMEPPVFKELLWHMRTVPELTSKPEGSFFIQLNANQQAVGPELKWCAVEYNYEIEDTDFAYWPAALMTSDEPADVLRMDKIDERQVYQLEWDGVRWVLGYSMILQVEPDTILSGRN